MPTENNEIGTMYIQDIETGEYKEVGGIREIHLELEDNDETMDLRLDETVAVIPIVLTRKIKRRFCKLLGMPKYQITEVCFPKKKKRGTMRRNKWQSKVFYQTRYVGSVKGQQTAHVAGAKNSSL